MGTGRGSDGRTHKIGTRATLRVGRAYLADMQVAVLPPEYFPGPSAAALMARSEVVVLGDTFRYARQTRQNRACLRTPDGRQWITVPVGHGQHGRAILETRIRESESWRDKHLKALRFNYGTTPYFEHYIDRIEGVLRRAEGSLASLTVPSTRLVADLMGLEPVWHLASALDGAPRDPEGIRAVLAADRVLVVDPLRAGPRVERFPFEAPAYRQRFDGFVPGCSVLDLLMMHGPATRDILLSGAEPV